MTVDVTAANMVEVRGAPFSLASPDPDQVASLVAGGLFAPGELPTIGRWYDPADLEGSAERARSRCAGVWVASSGDFWELPLGVFVDSEMVGVQTMMSVQFCASGAVQTSSWLAPHWRGHGIGTWARVAALQVAFGAMGATSAVSYSLAANDASVGVSRRCGYRRTEILLDAFRGEIEVLERFELSRARWAELASPQLQVSCALPRCRRCARTHPLPAPVNAAPVSAAGVPIRP